MSHIFCCFLGGHFGCQATASRLIAPGGSGLDRLGGAPVRGIRMRSALGASAVPGCAGRERTGSPWRRSVRAVGMRSALGASAVPGCTGRERTGSPWRRSVRRIRMRSARGASAVPGCAGRERTGSPWRRSVRADRNAERAGRFRSARLHRAGAAWIALAALCPGGSECGARGALPQCPVAPGENGLDRLVGAPVRAEGMRRARGASPVPGCAGRGRSGSPWRRSVRGIRMRSARGASALPGCTGRWG